MNRLIFCFSVGVALSSLSATAASACDEKASDYSTCIAQLYRQPVAQWPAPQVDADVAWQEMAALPDHAPAPPENPFSEAKAELGKKLFNDPKLSRSGQIACASCHEADMAFADGRRVSFGHDRQNGRRNAPSLVMSGYSSQLFWDGRGGSLEQQAMHPIVDPVEMAFDIPQLLERLNTDAAYHDQFAQVFGDGPITTERIGQALATFQRTLVKSTRNTPFEQLLRGRPQRMTDEQLYGLHVFRTKARCMNCHFGPALSDEQFHNVGLSYYGRAKYEDLGRYEVTRKPEDVGAFRTPSLRLVMKTAPWMHNGLFVNMEGTLAFYNMGMPRPRPNAQQVNDPLFPTTSERLKVLNMDKDELRALRSFLDTL
ncbi:MULTISPECIES: cytochrome-c peroxidase [Pseudomonas]|uniref:Cytochrome-c peroxidase n=1 Tax=Pseudomonas saxonica TaxID=2600598 RepID=A0ABY3GKH9_9PSED|nr:MULTISPECIES: cytochrome c peroxidase [Pseudomonas]MCH4873753.1 cytochrome-c peroxidase [Pseudomonas sp. TMW22091]TWR91007.1 cytochrome-c peroxidase [Pseudomonas saxonica]